MSKKLFLLICFSLFSLSGFCQAKSKTSQSNASKKSTSATNNSEVVKSREICDFKANYTEVYIIPGSVESTDVKPRQLTDDEKCLVEQSRKDNEIVVLKLDMYTEVKIFPKSNIKE
jgi:hypothetical protein